MTQVYDFFLSNIKANFIQWLMQNNFYSTMALMAQCQISISDEVPTACIICRWNQPPQIKINRILAEESPQQVLNMILFHEIRHIIQIAHNSNAYNCITYPDWCATDNEKKLAYRLVSNRAMDIALHEDFYPLFGDTFYEPFNEALRSSAKKQVALGLSPAPKDDDYSAIGIQIRNPEWDKNMDFVYYAQKIIDEIEEDAKNGGVSGEQQNGFDEHDIDEGEGAGDEDDGTGAGAGATKSWLEKLVKRAAQEGHIMSKHHGKGHGDAEYFLGKVSLDQYIIDFINQIQITANRIALGNTSYRYSYGRMNKLWPDQGLPGKVKTVDYSAGCFFVADVSGSMWSPEILNQLLPCLEILQKKHAIAGAYACDVEIKPFTNKVEGGGGTELGKAQVEQILKMNNLKPGSKIDIVYATDGYVDLTEINNMDNVKLHTVIISEEYTKQKRGAS